MSGQPPAVDPDRTLDAAVPGLLWFTDDDGQLCALTRMTIAVRPAPSGAQG